jgi:hypothetical protein
VSESEPHRPVFVDPSGRRRQLVRVLAVLGAVLVAGYLMLVLIAAIGGPDTPAARLPLLPERPPVANPGSGAETPTVAPTTAAEPSTTVNRPAPTTATTTASVPAAAPPAPAPATTSSRPSRASRPSEPPGNGGGPPTSPPGNGG